MHDDMSPSPQNQVQLHYLSHPGLLSPFLNPRAFQGPLSVPSLESSSAGRHKDSTGIGEAEFKTKIKMGVDFVSKLDGEKGTRHDPLNEQCFSGWVFQI